MQQYVERKDRLSMIERPTFIDAFAGCGGLSLGLMRSGWKGLFAIEKDSFAFDTLKSNLLDGNRDTQYQWPEWLPQEPSCIDSLLETHKENLELLRGKVDLLAGGPPCQGFSSAGKRNPADPRNTLMNSYLDLVRILEPRIVLIENVHGITLDFTKKENPKESINYSKVLLDALSEAYVTSWRMLDSSDFGVPQARNRFFLIGIRRDIYSEKIKPFESLESLKSTFLRKKGLVNKVGAAEAISDLEIRRNGKINYPYNFKYEAIGYVAPRTVYQKLMRDGETDAPSNTRLARHRKDISERFQKIISICHKNGRLNKSIGRELREAFGLKKQALRVLDPDKPSPTITSMPDDLLHYSEPRTLTVRENARLQSFPDWYDFKGKYTSGGHRRKREVPRFTQVANAVPPLLAEVIGTTILHCLSTQLEVLD
ncbi:DNA cytosine methyltransferase [Pseudomonas aeruginosa]